VSDGSSGCICKQELERDERQRESYREKQQGAKAARVPIVRH